jgi:hypothetical protein
MRLSRRFTEAVRLSPLPAYRLVRNAGNFHPSLLSKWIHGAELIRPNDERVIAVGRELGLKPSECFDLEPDPPPAAGAAPGAAV